mmetsp:Transcript_39369/g.103863  ORF Transcript_39369/g.103863 Transcript_39369/m.103863 type:complete len:88 (-) Transcript_39369:409-672(-)
MSTSDRASAGSFVSLSRAPTALLALDALRAALHREGLLPKGCALLSDRCPEAPKLEQSLASIVDASGDEELQPNELSKELNRSRRSL